MKKTTLFLLICVGAFAASRPAQAQTPNKIIDRYYKAVGGSAVKRIKNTTLRGATKVPSGPGGRFEYRIAGPDRFRIDFEGGDRRESESFNGKSAWRLDSHGLRTLLGVEAKRMRLEALLANTRLRDLARYHILTSFAGKAVIEGREANAIEFVRDDVRIKLYFDAATNLPLKQERETTGGMEEVFFGDYRAVDGVMEPFSIRFKSLEHDIQVEVDKVEHNLALDEAPFRYPQIPGSQPLPDLELLLKSIVANQEKIEALREHYSCRLTETQRKQESNGRVKESETKVYEVTPVFGAQVERLISVDGKDLSASEREKEDRRVQSEVEDLVKKHEKKLKKEELADGKPDADEGHVTILDFLRICEISSVRRETFRGRDVIVFDFEPRKGFQPKNRAESFASKLAGTMWVDPTARQVARLEARLVDSFKVGGGLLASIAPSSALALEQEKVGDEIWLPSSSEFNLSAKVLLIARFNRSFLRRYSDYKKYQVDSKYDLDKTREGAKPNVPM